MRNVGVVVGVLERVRSCFIPFWANDKKQNNSVRPQRKMSRYFCILLSYCKPWEFAGALSSVPLWSLCQSILIENPKKPTRMVLERHCLGEEKAPSPWRKQLATGDHTWHCSLWKSSWAGKELVLPASAPELWLRAVYLRTQLGFWGQSQLQLAEGSDCDSHTAGCPLGRWGGAEGETILLGSLLALGRPGPGLMPTPNNATDTSIVWRDPTGRGG